MMAKEAAIQASYADYRRVKGRKVLQLIFEVPLEQAPQVHEAFGEPLPDGSTWVAVARIDKTVADKPKGGKLCQRAAILCNEGAFQEFMLTRMADQMHVANGDTAEALRRICGIESRKQLDHDQAAAKLFLDLAARYEAWKLV